MAECILPAARGVIPPTAAAVELELYQLDCGNESTDYLPGDWQEKFFSARMRRAALATGFRSVRRNALFTLPRSEVVGAHVTGSLPLV
ncbi:MAG: hypothetical protein U0792_15105 [Gemmataceae bacterium]